MADELTDVRAHNPGASVEDRRGIHRKLRLARPSRRDFAFLLAGIGAGTIIGKFYVRAADAVYKLTGEATPVGMPLQAATYGGDSVYMAVTGAPKTLIIHVHSFSGDEREITGDAAKSALLAIPDTVVICPRLYGPAGNPNTCGSPAQLALLNNIIQQAIADYGCDTVLLVGASGGGGVGPTFMGAYPGVSQGASFWCGYYDLATWYQQSIRPSATYPNGTSYHTQMDATFGGPPTGALAAVYKSQSPSGVYQNMRDCTIYINDGRLDSDIDPDANRVAFYNALQTLPVSAHVMPIYIPYPNMGHTIDWPTAVTQLKAMITPVA